MDSNARAAKRPGAHRDRPTAAEESDFWQLRTVPRLSSLSVAAGEGAGRTNLSERWLSLQYDEGAFLSLGEVLREEVSLEVPLELRGGSDVEVPLEVRDGSEVQVEVEDSSEVHGLPGKKHSRPGGGRMKYGSKISTPRAALAPSHCAAVAIVPLA